MATKSSGASRIGDPPNRYPLGHPKNPHTAAQAPPVEKRVPTADPRSVPRGAQSPEKPVEEGKAPDAGVVNDEKTSGGEADAQTASGAASPSPAPAPAPPESPSTPTEAAPAAPTPKG